MKQSIQSPSWLTKERAIIGGGLLLAVVVLVVSIMAIVNPPVDPRVAIVEGVESFPGLVPQHVNTPVTYPQSPPAGGPHNPVWQNCGFYDAPVATEAAIHSLEHGAVWVAYRQDLAAAELNVLRQVSAPGSKLLVSMWEGELPAPMIASAWGVQRAVGSASDPALEDFVRRFAGSLGSPGHDAPCSGGQR